MTTGHVTRSTKHVFDDLMDVLPLIKACNNDVDNCACTDPSYNYTQKCVKKPGSEHSGRRHCTYGKPREQNDPVYENSLIAGTGTGDYKHRVGTATGRKEFTPSTGTGTGTGTTSYPKGLLFCSNPTATGVDALPTQPKSNITIDENGTIDAWNTENGGSANQPNLGFDKN